MKFDDVKKLNLKKYRQLHRCYLVEGEHLVLELAKAAIVQPYLADSHLYVTERYQDWQSPFETTLISDKRMAALCDTKTPQGIIARVPMPAAPSVDDTSALKTIYLWEPQDPGNLGTILRTLGWFGGFSLAISPNSVDPYNPKVVRSSMGAIFHVPITLDTDLQELAAQHGNVAVLDINGDDVRAPEFNGHSLYLFGNEGRGVPHQELSNLTTTAYSIAGNGDIESLNLATAVNISAFCLS